MIQTLAVWMFVERGYDATTVADIAEAAGVAPMTVYRHFPTKEDLVLVDQNGPLVAEHIAATSPAQPLVRRIGSALVAAAATLTGGARPDDPATGDTFLLARLQLMISTPALRARHLDSHYALQQAIVDALTDDATDPDAAFRARAAAGACRAPTHTGLVRWAEDDGRTELPGLTVHALAAASGADAVDVDPAG